LREFPVARAREWWGKGSYKSDSSHKKFPEARTAQQEVAAGAIAEVVGGAERVRF